MKMHFTVSKQIANSFLLINKRVASRNSGDQVHLNSRNAGSSTQSKNKSSGSGWLSSNDGRMITQMQYEEQKFNNQASIRMNSQNNIILEFLNIIKKLEDEVSSIISYSSESPNEQIIEDTTMIINCLKIINS